MVTLLEGRHIHFTKKLDSSSSVTGLQRGVLILGSVMRVCFFVNVGQVTFSMEYYLFGRQFVR